MTHEVITSRAKQQHPVPLLQQGHNHKDWQQH
jgi:hypothetical protein